jgi:valyl-tRNA synthetase
MNDNAGSFNGMDRFECRKKVIEELDKQGLLIKIKKMVHSVGHSERTDVMVEPYLSKQWFVKMRPLADRVMENQGTEDKVNFVPKRFEKILLHWMEISHDWCISRQLWWGHRIPAWYRGEEVYVGEETPEGDGWSQDTDVLDTWFSSALWPFSTLGWPNNTADLNRYYPNSVLVTAYDIILFWVCRMVFQGLEFTNERPFKDCLIHGLIRDKQGRKMSKSLGNGVDPMDVIDMYGADALRFFLTTNSAPGQDLRYDEDKVKSSWNFINKLWNASRFVLMNLEGFKNEDYTLDNQSITDKWIMYKLNETIKQIRKHMDKYEFNVVGTTLYNFIWNDFCDWYIELSKINIDNNTTKSVLLYALTNILKLLHPFTPYVTEEIYQMLPIHELSIMISDYPKYNKSIKYNKEIDEVNKIIEIITKIRNTKQENNIGKEYYLKFNLDDESANLINQNSDMITRFTKGVIVNKIDSSLETKLVTLSYGTLTLCYEGNINKEEELEKLYKEKEILISNIERREKLLSNPGYVSKAPVHLVEEEKRKLEEEKSRLKVLNGK